jgi:hypothetical protein
MKTSAAFIFSLLVFYASLPTFAGTSSADSSSPDTFSRRTSSQRECFATLDFLGSQKFYTITPGSDPFRLIKESFAQASPEEYSRLKHLEQDLEKSPLESGLFNISVQFGIKAIERNLKDIQSRYRAQSRNWNSWENILMNSILSVSTYPGLGALIQHSDDWKNYGTVSMLGATGLWRGERRGVRGRLFHSALMMGTGAYYFYQGGRSQSHDAMASGLILLGGGLGKAFSPAEANWIDGGIYLSSGVFGNLADLAGSSCLMAGGAAGFFLDMARKLSELPRQLQKDDVPKFGNQKRDQENDSPSAPIGTIPEHLNRLGLAAKASAPLHQTWQEELPSEVLYHQLLRSPLMRERKDLRRKIQKATRQREKIFAIHDDFLIALSDETPLRISIARLKTASELE